MKSIFITSINGAKKTYINWTNELLIKLDNIGGELNIYNEKEIKQKIKTLHLFGVYINNCDFFGSLGEYKDFLLCLCKNLYIKKNKNFPQFWFPRLYFYLDETKNIRYLEFYINTSIVLIGYYNKDNKQNNYNIKNIILYKDYEFEKMQL